MNLITDLKLYFYQQRLRREARAWLSANDTTSLAARLMFILNHYAYNTWRGVDREFIYKLKNCLLCHLYQSGYCASAHQQVQRLKCRGCGGTGQYSKFEKCYRCMGTGIYRQHLLYSFEFLVNGRLYNWHQPASLVWWKVDRVDCLPGEYDRSYSPDQELETAQVELYALTVFEYLRKVGALEYKHSVTRKPLRVEPPMTLQRVITRNYKVLKQNMYWKRYHLKRRIGKMVAAVMRDRIHAEWMNEDEIPF